MYIGELSGTYKQLDKLSETLSHTLNGTHKVECKEIDVQTYYEIANSFEDQIKTLSVRQRTKTKRVYKELRDKGITLKSIAADEQNYMSFLDAFIDMHQANWQSLGMAGHFGDWPHARELHQEIARAQIKQDRLRLLKIMLNDQCIGYEYIYKFNNTYCWFLSARTDLSDFPRVDFHRIAFGEKINHAINDKVKWIDAMRGYYEYKLVMGGQMKPVHSVIVYAKKGGSYFRYKIFKKLAWALNIVYWKIWRRRVIPRLRIKPKSLLNIWIKTGMFARLTLPIPTPTAPSSNSGLTDKVSPARHDGFKFSWLYRFSKYYRKNGLFKTLHRIYLRIYRFIFKSRSFVFYIENNKFTPVLDLPKDIIIERRNTYHDAIQPDMQSLIKYWCEENEMNKTKERFEKGAILWILKHDKVIVGFGWSIRGKMLSPYYLPLTTSDAVLFDYMIFEEFRGRGLYALLVNYILSEIYLEGVTRTFIDSFEWNTASIKGIEKTGFKQYGIAKKFHFLGRTITIWS